jgi:hypothetical protein
MRRLLWISVCLIGLCSHPARAQEGARAFSAPVLVQIHGYNGHTMEPFLTRDGALLYFNNRNDPKDQTDLHVAHRISDTSFRYLGPVTGANSPGLDGVASLDRAGNFYFISSRDYDSTGNTLWAGRLADSTIQEVAPLTTNFTPKKLLRLNIDMEVSADGKTLYVAENRWDLLRGIPATSDITMATKTATGFKRLPNADTLMAEINTAQLEFAPATSADELTLYFTRLNMKALRKGKPNAFAIMMATRPDTSSPWGVPTTIAASRGHVEAPTVTPNGCALYFHRKDGEQFRLYFMRQMGCGAE